MDQFKLPPEQQAIRDKCFHPTGTFIEFRKDEIEQSIPARFEKIVNIYPHRVAVKALNEQLTYTELNRAANRVARSILDRCETSQAPIGLLLPKSVDLVIAILGALKAGKICVLMDPVLPPARLSSMVDDTQAQMIVTNHEGAVRCRALVGQHPWLDIEELEDSFAVENVKLPILPDAFAFIFYTSGSTGLPKSIIENHRNLLHNTMTETNDYHICAEDKLTFVASVGRDIFRAVLNGAAVYPIDLRREGFTGLGRLLIDEEITIYNSVVSVFRQFASALVGDEQFPHLRLIKLMGETVYRKDVELYRKHFSDDCIFVNMYGPNETGLISHYLVDKATRVTSNLLPVGHAATDKTVFVVDDAGNEIGFEQPGEIVVRSRYLSPGYWRQTNRTLAAFPITSSEGMERLFHTGDLGSMSSDGCLVHLGRIDSQVKIRGNRVDIIEVETALLDIDTVREAAVVASEDEQGNMRLVAYIVSHSSPPPTTSLLRNKLAAKLRNYMIPRAFVFLDKLPLRGIGKVDRRALPAPGMRRPELDTPFVPSRSPVEQQLASIWAEVLALDQVGIHDNFFDLGGHSLAAMRVVSQVIKQFQLELPLQSLFQSPTVAEMAAIITQNQAKKASPEDLARLLSEVEALSEEEAQKQLAGESARSSKGDGHE
jgi:amino acid adenylation domain-containing protein